jgi:hypothetical protein
MSTRQRIKLVLDTTALVFLIWLGLTLVCALFSAALAHANTGAFSGYAGDQDQYAMWEDVIDFAPTVSASTAGAFGQRMCLMLDSGTSEGKLINDGSTQYGVDPAAARYLIHAAEFHYCPSYYGVSAGTTV